ncbi:CD276 antigen homolog isoform X2 [Hemiscyllium ocellatum]|uniref:CD276 antigen homolog isoform X2 n=1 Tax=Hemiscyllium ocellatum TaxID=170820 RepID=UPI0029666904|nr:CD276 antigen homolog isoform X2 [Hemiscyllium ocellatum]
MFLSSFSVSCQCLPLILIAVPVPGKELQGHSSQKLLAPLLLLLLLNVVAAVSGDSPVPVSGFLGEQVVLPCTYKGNVPVSDLLVIWRTEKEEILYEFVDGNDDLAQQDPRFRNRANLFKGQLEQGNWSVLISDLRETDQDVYQCWIQKRVGVLFYSEQSDSVDLSVKERAPTPGPNTHVSGPGVTTRARVGLGIGIAAVFVVGIVGYIVLKRQRRKQNLHKMAALNGDPLREVTMHQDGAAGEQNLLGNGAAQH